MKYILTGNPIPLARARYTTTHMYDSQKNIKLLHRISLSSQHNDQPLFEGPVHLDIHFYLQPPHKATVNKLKKIINQFHFYKPDISNLIKFVEDIATGILYKDDCIISSISSKKVYDVNPRTEFTITPLKEFQCQ